MWRDATAEDRRAFEYWRCRDEDGPLVAGSTWEGEVTMVNGFYKWAVARRHVAESPIVQRLSRARSRCGCGVVAVRPRRSGVLMFDVPGCGS